MQKSRVPSTLSITLQREERVFRRRKHIQALLRRFRPIHDHDPSSRRCLKTVQQAHDEHIEQQERAGRARLDSNRPRRSAPVQAH